MNEKSKSDPANDIESVRTWTSAVANLIDGNRLNGDPGVVVPTWAYSALKALLRKWTAK